MANGSRVGVYLSEREVIVNAQSLLRKVLRTRTIVAVLGSGLGLELGGISVNGMTSSLPSFSALIDQGSFEASQPAFPFTPISNPVQNIFHSLQITLSSYCSIVVIAHTSHLPLIPSNRTFPVLQNVHLLRAAREASPRVCLFPAPTFSNSLIQSLQTPHRSPCKHIRRHRQH